MPECWGIICLNSDIFFHKRCYSGQSTEFSVCFLKQPFKRDIYVNQVSNPVCLKCQVQKFKWSSVAGPWYSAHQEVADVSCRDSCHADMRWSSTPPRQPAGHQTTAAGVNCSPPYGAMLLWPPPVCSVSGQDLTLVAINLSKPLFYQKGLRIFLDAKTRSVTKHTEHFSLLMGLAWYFVILWGGCHSHTAVLQTGPLVSC